MGPYDPILGPVARSIGGLRNALLLLRKLGAGNAGRQRDWSAAGEASLAWHPCQQRLPFQGLRNPSTVAAKRRTELGPDCRIFPSIWWLEYPIFWGRPHHEKAFARSSCDLRRNGIATTRATGDTAMKIGRVALSICVLLAMGRTASADAGLSQLWLSGEQQFRGLAAGSDPVANQRPRADVEFLAASSVRRRESYRELRLEPLCCPHPSRPRNCSHEREYPWRKDRF